MNNLNKALKPETKREQIIIVETDISHLNKRAQTFEGQIKNLNYRLEETRKKIAKKTKYKIL